jgi:hypothetical protein
MKTSDQRSAVMLRFYSANHCIMAKHYFDMRKGYEGRSFYVRDYADREILSLKWDTYPKVGESAALKRKQARAARMGGASVAPVTPQEVEGWPVGA